MRSLNSEVGYLTSADPDLNPYLPYLIFTHILLR